MIIKKNVTLILIALVVSFSVGNLLSLAQDTSDSTALNEQTIIKGEVKEIAEKGNYIIIGATKLITTKEFIEDLYLEVGDKVEVSAKKSLEGLEIVEASYIFEDEIEEELKTKK